MIKKIDGNYELQELIAFYKGHIVNPEHLYIKDMWDMDFEQLEENHSYIQWLFPLKLRSRYNPYAPVLSPIQVKSLIQDIEIQAAMFKSLKVMLEFYGFKMMITGDGIDISFAEDFEERSKVWLRPCNHNFKRISRILNSLCLFDMTEFEVEFRKVLQQVYEKYSDVIGERTALYWRLE